MFAWLSGSAEPLENASTDIIGSRLSNQCSLAAAVKLIERADSDTIFEAPETPAPVFAMRAFKQVLFGTPQHATPAPIFNERPPIQAVPPIKGQRLQPSDVQKERESRRERHTSNPLKDLAASSRMQPPPSPSKPTGILMTPGTINGRRKQVKFGEQVVDNEGKRNKYSKSGLPDNCPGKFPSPWTPKTTTPASSTVDPPAALKSTSDSTNEKKVESRFKEILDLGRQPKTETKHVIRPPRSKDDGNVTTDLTLPCSASGRYWKNQYEQYSSNSVMETQRLIVKHKLAKDYARMKDDEAQGLRTQLDYERRKRGKREGSLERQVKEMRGRLKDALADNAKLTAEVTVIRMQMEKHGLHKEQYEKKPVGNIIQPSQDPITVTRTKITAKSATTSSPDDIWLDTDTDGEAKIRARRLRRSAKTEQLTSRGRTPDLDSANVTPTSVKIKPRTNSPRGIANTRLTPRLTKLSPLSERSLNLPSPTPNKSRVGSDGISLKTVGLKKSGILQARPMSPNITHGSIFHLDFTTPIEALEIQASQPVTPVAESKKKPNLEMTPASNRARGKTLTLEGQRLEEARLRVAERRKMKRDSRVRMRD
jgi:hypothetical protein